MGFIQKILDFFFPQGFECPICGVEKREHERVCEHCQEQMPFITHACIKCGRKVKLDNKVCDRCRRVQFSFDRGYSVFNYDLGIVGAISRMKYGMERGLCAFFIEYLTEKAIQIEEPFDMVTYVPMAKVNERARGYNQGYALAKGVAENLAKELFVDIKKVRVTKHQQQLNSKERVKNLVGAYKVTRKIKDKSVLIIDDVLTTGTTMDEIAKVLKKAGAKHVYFLTIAATSLKKIDKRGKI